MKRNENLQKNLITLLKIFKNRPYHLSKYLLENLAFSKSFLNKIQNSEKLSSLSDESDTDFPSYFPNITQMEDFYNSLLEEVREISETKRLGDLTENLNSKLVDLINNEKYEEAAALRDYMTKNGIKKNS
jgi:hypothetical protein